METLTTPIFDEVTHDVSDYFIILCDVDETDLILEVKKISKNLQVSFKIAINYSLITNDSYYLHMQSNFISSHESLLKYLSREHQVQA